MELKNDMGKVLVPVWERNSKSGSGWMKTGWKEFELQVTKHVLQAGDNLDAEIFERVTCFF